MPAPTASKAPIPIVFIHQGWFAQFHLALQHARHFHPHSPILHLGDRPYRHAARYGEFVPIKKFKTQLQPIANHYQHFSPNPYRYELFCIQRWFLLLAVMQQRNWDRCWVFDSDVLLFDRFDNIEREIAEFSITINGRSPHATLIADRAALQDFCDWTIGLYSKRQSELKEFESKYGYAGAGISDMTLFYGFGAEVGPIGDNSIIRNEAVIDNNLSESRLFLKSGKRIEWQMAGTFKRLEYRDQIPYATTTDGQSVRMRLLHFQGGAAKPQMVAHATDVPLTPLQHLQMLATRAECTAAQLPFRVGQSIRKRLPGLGKKYRSRQ
jgi:hypothetical protein